MNLQDRSRHMIKFIFMRAEKPGHPSWDFESATWKPPGNLVAPCQLEPAWRDVWNWHCGEKAVSRRVSESALIEALRHPFGQVGFFAVQALSRIGTESASQAVIDDLISCRWDTSLSIKRLF